MVIFYNENGERIGKDYEVGWSFDQKRNKEGTGKIELIHYPAGAKYATLYKGTEEIKTVVLNENSSNEKRVNTSVKTLESLFKNYRLPENWRGWNKQPLSFVLADSIYGFDYIQKSTLADFTDYIEKVNIALNKIKDGDIHLDYHEVEGGIQYYEQGQITFAFDCGDAVSQRYLRWVETTGEKVYIGIQSVSSNTPITDISQVDFSNVPILTINRGVENDSSFSGIPIASDKRYVAVRFILKYVNPDWISDFATHKVYNENNVLVDRTVRGFTPVLRAFEIITRKKTEFNVISSPIDMGELIEGIELSNITIWEAIQKIREKYPFDTRCYFEDGKVYFEFSKSLVKDKKKKAGYMLRAGDKITRHLNNTNIKELKTNIQKVNVLHCYGEGEKQQRLYVRIPETGTYDNMATVEDVFTDTKIKTREELRKRGLEVLKEKRKDDKPVFEVETVLPIHLLDEVSLVHPETNTIYDVVVEEENISYKENKLTQKFGIGGFLFNPIEALIKKEKYPDMRDYAMQPFGLTAYGKHKAIVLVWQGVEENYIVRWKEKGSTEYNYRNVKGHTTEFNELKGESTTYLFAVAGTVVNVVSDYTAEIEAHSIQVRDGKDGSAKFLPSLTVQGDYENQIGTYQGQLYRWNNSKWELLNAVMPVNPICAYDFAAVRYRDITPDELKNFSFRFGNYQDNFVHTNIPKTITDSLSNGMSYRVSADFRVIQGNPQYASFYYFDYTINTGLYSSNTKVINGQCHCVLDFVCKNTDLQGHNLQVIFYSGEAGKTAGVASEWSNFRIETISGTQAIDSSGNGIYSKIVGDVEKVKDDKVGMALKFNKGVLTRPSQGFIGVGKKWSHSRWIKIDKDELDKALNPRFWNYGSNDYCYIDIAANGGQVSYVNIVTYKNDSNVVAASISKEDLLDNEWHNLIVCNEVQTSYAQKMVYLDGKKIADKKILGDFSNFVNNASVFEDMTSYGSYTKGRLGNLLFFDRLLTDQEALWLALNPQYPVKNYTLADWSISPDNPDNVLANATPKYLGVVETQPTTRTATIIKGERLGAVDANPGDWVLSGKTIGEWKVGVCYRWSGLAWKPLEPEVNYSEAYQACLVHLFDIEELKQQTGHYGALFANMLIAQEAFITKLSGDIAFLKKLVVKKLHIDSVDGTHQDFEAWFDETNGLKIQNEGKKVFEITPQGDISTSGFKVRFGNTKPKETKFTPNYNISQQDLSSTQKIFYNGLEVEKITVEKKNIKQGGGKVICYYDAQYSGTRIYYYYASYYIDKEETTYTIFFKNHDHRVDRQNVFKLDKYSRHDENEGTATGEIPYPSVNKYPVTITGGCAPGYGIIKDFLIETKDLFILNNIPSSENIEGFPSGTLYRQGNQIYVV